MALRPAAVMNSGGLAKRNFSGSDAPWPDFREIECGAENSAQRFRLGAGGCGQSPPHTTAIRTSPNSRDFTIFSSMSFSSSPCRATCFARHSGSSSSVILTFAISCTASPTRCPTSPAQTSGGKRSRSSASPALRPFAFNPRSMVSKCCWPCSVAALAAEGAEPAVSEV